MARDGLTTRESRLVRLVEFVLDTLPKVTAIAILVVAALAWVVIKLSEAGTP